MTKSAFDDAARRDLRLSLRSNGMNVNRAAQLVDLACHAADKSIESLFTVCKTAPDTGMTLMAIEIALQLAGPRMAAILERAHDLGRTSGCPQYSNEVGMRL